MLKKSGIHAVSHLSFLNDQHLHPEARRHENLVAGTFKKGKASEFSLQLRWYWNAEILQTHNAGPERVKGPISCSPPYCRRESRDVKHPAGPARRGPAQPGPSHPACKHRA